MNSPSSFLRRVAFVAPLLLAMASAAVLMPLPAQAASVTGSGKLVNETRTVPDFEAVKVQAPVDVQLRQGTPLSVTLSGDDNLLPLLETVVENSNGTPTLVLRFKRDSGPVVVTYGRSQLRATVVMPKLSSLAVAGSGDIKAESFNVPTLRVSVAGSGDVAVLGLSCDELHVNVAGSGDVRGSGKAARLKVNLAGSGDVRLADLRAETVAVSIAGSGDAAVQAQGTLDVNIVGSGDVSYSGAARVKSSVTGSGTVRPR